MSVRVRFAPSPTGPLHIGGVRTALYNYLFAKQNNGDFILRIEDTDQKRFVQGAEKYLLESLKWCGIQPNEGFGIGGEYGSYKQSERSELYKKHIQVLLDKKKAYYAFDKPEDLDALRKEAEKEKNKFAYDSKTRKTLDNSLNLSEEETKKRIESGENYVIRFKTPEDEMIVSKDLIRGEVRVDSNTLDDKILFKSDGLPTYHLANVVDDFEMKISHVIRGEEWLPSLPLHSMLYDAFEFERPQFAHLPLILGPKGGKLSKRDGDKYGFPVFPLDWKDETLGYNISGFREAGYLSEALVNILALLGWNSGEEKEIFSMEELIERFSLEKVGKSGAKFDLDKSKWINHSHIQETSNEKLGDFVLDKIDEDLRNVFDKKTLHKIIGLNKERANTLSELLDSILYLFKAPEEFNEKNFKKVIKEDSKELISILKNHLSEENMWTADEIKQGLSDLSEKKELKMGKVMQTLRLAVVGSLSGMDLPMILEILGKEEVIERINFITSKL